MSELKVFKHASGLINFKSDYDSWSIELARIQSKGFDGMSAVVSDIDAESQELFLECLTYYDLSFIARIENRGGASVDADASVVDCLRHFEEDASIAKRLGAVLVSSRAGQDWWSDQHAVQFLKGASEIASRLGVEACHETHRQGTLCDPFRAQRVLPLVPAIAVHLDISAWCCACGRVFDEKNRDDAFWKPLLALVSGRCKMIGSQVSNGFDAQLFHVGDGEHADIFGTYKLWWSSVWSAMVANGHNTLYSLAEGAAAPPNHAVPFIKKGFGDESDHNKFVKDSLRSLFSANFPGAKRWHAKPTKKRKLEPKPEPVVDVSAAAAEAAAAEAIAAKAKAIANLQFPLTDIEGISAPLPEPGILRHEWGRNRRVYASLDNETPKQIAAKFGVKLKQVLVDNKRLHPGLSTHAKLYKRTPIVLPWSDEGAPPRPESLVASGGGPSLAGAANAAAFAALAAAAAATVEDDAASVAVAAVAAAAPFGGTAAGNAVAVAVEEAAGGGGGGGGAPAASAAENAIGMDEEEDDFEEEVLADGDMPTSPVSANPVAAALAPTVASDSAPAVPNAAVAAAPFVSEAPAVAAASTAAPKEADDEGELSDAPSC